jgi:hypothetical protein
LRPFEFVSLSRYLILSWLSYKSNYKWVFAGHATSRTTLLLFFKRAPPPSQKLCPRLTMAFIVQWGEPSAAPHYYSRPA